MRTTLWQWGKDVKDYLAEGVLCKGLDLYSRDWEYALEYASKASALFLDVFARGSYEVPVKALLNMTAKQLSVWGAARSCSVKTSPLSLPRGRACVVLAGTERAAETLAEDLKQSGLPASHLESPSTLAKGTVTVTSGSLSAGFEFPEANFCAHLFRQVDGRKGQKEKR